MRLRSPQSDAEEEVPMAPLIDCVFLLLIFFLVTSMFKRFELLIPIELSDATSSLSQTASQEAVRLRLNADGQSFRTRFKIEGQNLRPIHSPIKDFATFLRDLLTERGSAVPLEVAVDEGTTAQRVIDLIDIAQIQGFTNVSVRSRRE